MLQHRTIGGCHGPTRQVAAVAARIKGATKPRQHLQHPSSRQAAAAAAAAQQRAHMQLVRASDNEDAEIDRMARQAAQPDVWSSDLIGNLVKVGLGAAVVAVVVLIASLAKPMYDNTIRSFPTPAEYEQYEQREEDADLL